MKLVQKPFQKVGDVAAVLETARASQSDATRELRDILRLAQQENVEWIETLFHRLRASHPLKDVLLLSEDGRVEKSWSTINDYVINNTPPTMEDVLALIAKDRKMHYVVTPQKGSVIFYFEHEEGQLLSLNRFESRQYQSINLQPPNIGISIRMAYLDRPQNGKHNPFGPEALRSKGLVLGRLGFWPIPEGSPKRRIGFGPQEEASRVFNYVPRVYFKGGYMTPLNEALLIDAGMLPMNMTKSINRIEVPMATENIIVNFLFAYTADPRRAQRPLVIRYDTYRPWLGDYPMHGGRQSR